MKRRDLPYILVLPRSLTLKTTVSMTFILNNKVPFQENSLKGSQAMLIFVMLKAVILTIKKEIKIFQADVVIILEV